MRKEWVFIEVIIDCLYTTAWFLMTQDCRDNKHHNYWQMLVQDEFMTMMIAVSIHFYWISENTDQVDAWMLRTVWIYVALSMKNSTLQISAEDNSRFTAVFGVDVFASQVPTNEELHNKPGQSTFETYYSYSTWTAKSRIELRHQLLINDPHPSRLDSLPPDHQGHHTAALRDWAQFRMTYIVP